MKAIEFLTELFDKPEKFSMDSYGDGYFSVNGNEYVVNFTDYGHKTEILFSDEAGSIEVTGAGNALRVFSTVASIILRYVKLNKPSVLMFTSYLDESSRTKLYDRLAKLLATKIPYTLSVHDSHNEREYTFTRNI